MNYTPEQLDAITTAERFVCVDAGAGSGKTRVLVDRIIHLLAGKQAALDEIVAITFTEKAASEMKERLRAAAHQRAPKDDPAGMTYWRQVARQADSSRISTIHAFCMGVLKQNALAVGVDPDFTVLGDAESHLLRAEVIQDILHRLLDKKDAATQRLAAEYGMKPLSKNLYGMLKEQGAIEDVLARFSFDDPERLWQEWEAFARPKRDSRIELLKARLLALDGCCSKPDDKKETIRIALLQIVAQVLASTSVDEQARAFAQVHGLDARGGSPSAWNPESAMKEVTAVLNEVREIAKPFGKDGAGVELSRRAAQLTVDLLRTYRAVTTAYDSLKAARAAYSFDDLILRALAVLKDQPEVCEQVAKSIRHLLIDEFQDTDYRQLEIANLLCAVPDGPALFVVGDAKQSIYQFRGAEVEVFHEVRERATRRITLDRNFRSVPEVLNLVNGVFARSGLLDQVESPYRPLASNRPSAGPCRVELLPVEGSDAAEALRENEADLLARRIYEMCVSEPVEVTDPVDGTPRPASFGDVAVLFRSARNLYLYERPLRALGIPYSVVAGTGFHERQEVMDIRNLLTCIAEPWDEMALLGVLRSPIIGMSDDALAVLCAGQRLPAVMSSAVLPEDLPERDRIQEARELIGDLRAHTELPLDSFLRYTLERSRYEAVLFAEGHLGPRKALNIRKIVELAEGFARSEVPRLRAFLRYLDDVAAEEIQESEAALQPEGGRSVTLMTIHKSKGLEFPIVIIPDLSRKRPATRHNVFLYHRDMGLAAKAINAEGDPVYPEFGLYLEQHIKDLEDGEYARVLYVAMTRARDWLVLSGAQPSSQSSGTWWNTIERVFGVSERQDGEIIARDGWQVRVRRTCKEARQIPRSPHTGNAPLKEEIERRVAPLPVPSPVSRIFSVTQLLPFIDEPTRTDGASPKAGHGSSPAALRGTIVHRFFEHWDFSRPDRGSIDHFVEMHCPDFRYRQRLAEDIDALTQRFLESPACAALAQLGLSEREPRFWLRTGGGIVSGAVDAILSDGSILDYKTGRHLPVRHLMYEWQVRLYAAAHRLIEGIEVPRGYICYLDAADETDRLHEVDASPPLLEEAMERAARAANRLLVLQS